MSGGSALVRAGARTQPAARSGPGGSRPRLPQEPELGAYFSAAWSAYIVFNRAFTDVFDVLRDAYALAVERLEEGSGRTRP